MRAPQLLLAIVVLGLLLGGAWLLTRGGDVPAAGVSNSEASPAAVAEEALSPGTLPEAEGDAELEAAPVAERTEKVAAEEPEEGPTQGRQRGVTGRVVDEFGNPLAEARVFVASGSGFGGDQIDRLASSNSGFGSVEQAETDRAGRFQIETRLRGELRFAVRASGFAPLRGRRDVQGPGLVELADFVLERSVILSGHVVDQAGNGIEGAAIEAIERSSGSGFQVTFLGGSAAPLAQSAAGGVFEVDELAAGPYRLRLSHPDHPDLTVEGSVDRPGQSQSGLRFAMEDGYTIAGSVLGLEPGQAGELLVRARPVGGEAFDPELGFGSTRMAEVAADGTFELRGLREGSYRLHAIDAEQDMALFASGRSAATLAETGERGVQIQLREPSGLTLRVLDAETGFPIEEYTVESGTVWMQALRDSEGQVATTHPDGRATFPELPLDQGEARTHLSVEAEGYQPWTRKNVALEPGVVLDLGEVRLAPRSMISVRVLDDATGEPVEGARVRLTEVAQPMGAGERRISLSASIDDTEVALPGSQDTSSAKTDAEGLAQLPSLPGKLCELSVKHRGYAEYTSEPTALPEQGGRELEARLTQGGSVTVLVLGADGAPKKGVRVKQSRVGQAGPVVFGRGSGSRRSNSKGLVEFDHLPAGTHNFAIQEAGGGMLMSGGTQIVMAGFEGEAQREGVDVEVGEGTAAEITLHARAEGEVSGKVTEGGEPLVGATLVFEEDKGGQQAEMMRMMPGFGGGGPSARTDSQGGFRQEGLKVGEYSVRIEHPSRVMPASFELSVREGENRASYELSLAILEGRVVDSEGKPAVGVEVKPKRHVEPQGGVRRQMMASFVVADGGGGAMTFSSGGAPAPSVKTDADGRYALRGVEPGVELVVETSSERFQDAVSDPVTCGENQVRRDVDIEVFEGGHLTVIVQNADGSPASFCLAELDYAGEADETPDPEREFVGETGQATVHGLRPGRWRVAARTVGMLGPGEGEDEEQSATPLEVEVEAGETAVVTLQLQ